jgi:hypothetical protein
MSENPPPPSSSLPPPVAGGTSTKYVAVVGLLGAGLLALLLWKHFGGDPVPVVVGPPLGSLHPAPVGPREDDVPPPPPIEDSGPDTGSAKSTTASNPSACDAKTCPGGMTPDLEAALAFRAKTAHKCYDDALAQDSTLRGSVKIGVRVASNGNICSATTAASDLSNPNVATCIANRFRQAGHFPPPAGGCLDVNVPISLLPPH